MEKEKKKRLNEEEIYYSYSESHNKKIKTIDNDYNILEIFNCKNFYFDKSLLIKEFLDDSENICITAPSKYGKTVNLIMMNKFFEMNYEGKENTEYRKIFEKLNIAKEIDKYGQNYIEFYQGKYPVIFLNFEDIKIGNSYDEVINSFKFFIENLFNYYEIFKIKILNDEKNKWENYINCSENSEINENDLANSISFLCKCLNEIFQKKIILLIDNYDSPILDASCTEFYDKFYNFYY
eukprot:jgi/Orpsp1_1/1179230/evm.model.c7180000068505.1